MSKHEIPTHDPYTGELNPYYEELTGEKNPFTFCDDETNYCFDLSELIGKEFRYQSKYGISTWIDKVKNVEPMFGLHTNLTKSLKPVNQGEEPKKFEIFGHTISLYIRSKRGNHLYELENCVVVEHL